jgi:hypothetical protein
MPDEAGTLDGGEQQRWVDDARKVADGRPLGGQIDHRVNTRQPVEELFEARRAGGAGHALDGQFEWLVGGTLKPAFSIAATTSCGELAPEERSTLARSLARLTVAMTPGRRFRTFSMRVAQAAQVMPVTGRSRRCRSFLLSCRPPGPSVAGLHQEPLKWRTANDRQAPARAVPRRQSRESAGPTPGEPCVARIGLQAGGEQTGEQQIGQGAGAEGQHQPGAVQAEPLVKGSCQCAID